MTVTATDDQGQTFAKDFTFEVNNVDESGTYENVETTGAPILGQSVGLTGTIADPDNLLNGNGESDFASITIEWFTDGESVKVYSEDDASGVVTADDHPTLEITEDMVGKQITAVVSYVDQGGFEGEFEAVDLGVAISDTAAVNIQIFEDAEPAAEDFADSMLGAAEGLDAMVSNIAAEMEQFADGMRAFFDNGGEQVVNVTSTGVSVLMGDYEVHGEFANFNPTTLAELNAAIEGFDGNDPATWTIDGGFKELSFDGPDGSLFAIEFGADDHGSGDNVRDVLRLVDQNSEAGTYKTLGLIGEFDNQIPEILDFVSGVADINAEYAPQYDAHFEDYPMWGDYGSQEEYDAAWAAHDAETYAIVDAENAVIVDYFVGASSSYDLDGFFLHGSDGSVADIGIDLDRASDDGEEDLVLFSAGDTTIAVWGTFPDTAVDLIAALDTLDNLPDGITDANYGDVLSDLAENGFEGFGLYVKNSETGEQEPVIRVTIDDFQQFLNGDIDADLSSVHSYEYTTEDGVKSVIYDTNEQYQYIGEGVDLNALYDIVEGVEAVIT